MAGLLHWQSFNTFGCHPVRYIAGCQGERIATVASLLRNDGGKSAVFCLVHFATSRRSSSVTAYAVPPSPRGKVFCRKNDTERVREVTILDALAHELFARTAGRYRARQGSNDYRRTNARIIRRHCRPKKGADESAPFFILLGICQITYRRVPCSGRGGRPQTGSSSALRDPRCRRSRRRSCR